MIDVRLIDDHVSVLVLRIIVQQCDCLQSLSIESLGNTNMVLLLLLLWFLLLLLLLLLLLFYVAF
jgi:hypothetical protein